MITIQFSYRREPARDAGLSAVAVRGPSETIYMVLAGNRVRAVYYERTETGIGSELDTWDVGSPVADMRYKVVGSAASGSITWCMERSNIAVLLKDHRLEGITSRWPEQEGKEIRAPLL